MSDYSEDPKNNRAVPNIAHIIKSVVSSAAETKTGALFINSRQAIPTRTTVATMGHIQLPTLIQTDDTTALGVPMKNI